MNKKTQKMNTKKNWKELNLLDLILSIWAGRKTIIITIIFFIAFGLFISFSSQSEYKTEVHLLPEITKQGGGVSNLLRQYSGLASIAGISLDGLDVSDALSPSIYPDIVQSTPLIIQIMNTQVNIPSMDTTASVHEYMSELLKPSLLGSIRKYSLELPFTIRKMLVKKETSDYQISAIDSPVRMDYLRYQTFRSIKKRIKSYVDFRNGVIIISSIFPDPEVSTQIVEKIVSYLTQYVTEYRIHKAKDNLAFIEAQSEEAQLEFYKAQESLADFNDKNRNVISAHTENERVRLQSYYDLTFNIYNTLSQQREQAKIIVQKETPVLKVLNPPMVPIKRNSPKRVLIMIVAVILGGFTGMGIVLIRNIYSPHHKKTAKQ